MESVTKHVKEIHQAGPPKVAKKLFKCSECSYSHLDNENVIMHIKLIHKKIFKCGKCDFTASNEKSAVNHLHIVHGQALKIVQVNLCQKLLFLHQLTHIMTTECSLNYKFNA